MYFEDSFFEDEIRSGFLVPTMVKRGWAATLEVLEDIDRVCKKYGLSYYAHLGTLIGAVRHNGFIPWDDDIDICMKRPDYMKFLEVAKFELADNYGVFNVYTTDRHDASLAGVLNSKQLCVKKELYDKYHGCLGTVGVDIFVLDYMPRDEESLNQQIEAIDFIVSLIAQYDDLTYEEQCLQLDLVKTAIGVEIIMGDESNPPTFQLGKILDQLCMLYTEDEADYICNMMTWQGERDRYFKKEWFDDVIIGNYEGFPMPLPVGYHEYLSLVYGDYMNPVRFGAQHAFPHFEGAYIAGRSELGFPLYTPEYLNMPRDLKVPSNVKSIAFIVSRFDWWKKIEPEYERVCEKYTEAEINVIVVPYFTKEIYGNCTGQYYDIEDFESVPNAIGYDEFGFLEKHTDIIYFQTPKDQYGEIFEIDERFFSEELYKLSDELILVPMNQMDSFSEDDGLALKMLKQDVRYPGIIVADRIAIGTGSKDNYLSALVDLYGEGTKAVWDLKMLEL